MYEFDGISLDGFPEISPFGIDGPVDSSPAEKNVTLLDNPIGDGSTLGGLPQLQNIVREIPLEIYRRFTATMVNLHTNPSFELATTGASALGAATIALDATEAKDGGTSLKTTTTAVANDGVRVAFAATVAAYSTSIWVLAPLGAPMAIKYDGGSNEAFTGTGAWQLVKLQNKVLTATTRYVHVIQLDTTARSFLVDAVCTTQTATAQYFFCGDSGDAQWSGAPHASTSTTLTGERAVGFSLGVLSQKARRAEALAQLGGIPLRYRPGDCPFRGTSNVISGKLTDWPYDIERAVGRATGKITLTQLGGIQGPEYKLTTVSKLAGVYGIDSMLPAAKGDAPGPARFELKNRDSLQWRFVQLGIEQRYASASTPRLVPASAMTALVPSGAAGVTNQSVTLTKTGTISGGSGNIYIGDTAFAIAFDTAAATVQAAIAALNGIGTGNVTATGGPLSSATPMVITFVGALAGVPINLRWDGSGLTGGGSVAASITSGAPAQIYGVSPRSSWADLGYIDVDLVGDFEVLAVAHFAPFGIVPTSSSQVRFTSAIGDAQQAIGPTNSPNIIRPAHRMLLSLGEGHFTKCLRGTQSTRVRIQGKGGSVNVEWLIFVPLEASSLRAAARPAASARAWATDTFMQTAGNIGVKSLDTLQSWATSGSTTDLFEDLGVVSRSTTADAAVGTNFNTIGREASVAVAHTWSLGRLKFAFSNAAPTSACGFSYYVNWVDANNWIRVYVNQAAGTIQLFVTVGGVALTGLPSGAYTRDTSQHQFEVVTFPTGRLEVWIDGKSQVRTYLPALRAGGALVYGARAGWVDTNSGGSTCIRTYDDFELLEIRDLAVANPTRIFEGRAPMPLTESAAGGVFAPTDGARLSRDPMILPAGVEGLQCRLVAAMNRENPDIAPWVFSGPGLFAVWHTPVYDVMRWEQ